DSQVNEVCRAMEMMVTTTTPSTSRRVMVARPGNGDSSRQSHCRESTGENRENRGELRKGRPSIPGWVKLLILRYLCLLLFNSFDHSHRRSPRAPVAESWSRDPETGTARAKAIAGNQQ